MNASSGATEAGRASEPCETDPIHDAIQELSQTLSSKNHDYKIDGVFSNFEFASGVSGINPADIMLSQIGIKIGRLKGLANNRVANNEATEDTIKDLAGYSIILYAYYRSLSKQDADSGDE